MATQSSKWATTFFWEQDLRSLYMNGLLNSLLKPGVYVWTPSEPSFP